MRAYIEKHPYLTIIILWFFVFTAHLGTLYPNIMEARNFVTAREMITDGNWILTTMDGLPRYEKPPLPTWLTAASAQVFGLDNIAALRLPAAIVTLALLFMMYSLSRSIVTQKFMQCEVEVRELTNDKLYALITTLILGTSFYIIFAGRNGTWDIFAHSFMLIGIYFLFQLFELKSANYKNALLAGLFIGLSFMSKGPVSHYALLLPFLIAYGFIYKFKGFHKKWLPIILMIVLIAALSSWWAIYIYQMDTAEATRIAEKESSRWIGYELKPFYYYWSFFTQSGIWTIPAFICLLYPYLKSRVSNLKAYQFALLWTVAAVVLLSLIPTKKSRYLLPVLIPLAMTVGFYIQFLFNNFHSLTSKLEKWPVYFNYGLIATIGIAFPLGAFLYFGDNLDGNYFFYILSSIALFATGVFIFYQLRKKNFALTFYGTVAFVMLVMSLGFPLSEALLGNPTYNSISVLKESETPVYVLNDLAPEMVWDYGKASIKITKEELINREALQEIGILTYPSIEKNSLDFLKEKYRVEWKETFDLNPVDSSKNSYKNRLKNDYYIISRKK
ncbi:ArnT family glycosyltransferase [Nonlabens antarcticus]|uniref:ArnT family glycosyltransferase n=1 Tax=Nonlabens antarcticus TaxID=392714 RepID=UPI001891A6CC|nr:glycosyltransferase family 39 protein [Nonlabens antarcticus]